VGNSRRSGPRTTHTLYRTLAADATAGVAVGAATPGSTATLPGSSRELKNCGRGYPCTLQYSNNSSLLGDGDGVGFPACSGAIRVIAKGPAGVEDEDDDDTDNDAATAGATAEVDSGGGALGSAVADARGSSVGGVCGSPVPLRLASTPAARGPGCHTRGGLRRGGPPRRGPDVGALADSAG